MELFKSDEMKKGFNEFMKTILPGVFACNLCKKFSCKWHRKFNVCCNLCREVHCKNCKKFIISKDILLKYGDEETRKYISNYIYDFLNISCESLNSFFPEIEINKIEKREAKEKTITKKRVKDEKNRSQVVNQKLPTKVKTGEFNFNGTKKIFLLIMKMKMKMKRKSFLH